MPVLKNRYQIVVNTIDPARAKECAQTKETGRSETQLYTLTEESQAQAYKGYPY